MKTLLLNVEISQPKKCMHGKQSGMNFVAKYRKLYNQKRKKEKNKAFTIMLICMTAPSSPSKHVKIVANKMNCISPNVP
jgi:uncharacterized membrane protein YdjX (TVP38/TMEM64 family)